MRNNISLNQNYHPVSKVGNFLRINLSFLMSIRQNEARMDTNPMARQKKKSKKNRRVPIKHLMDNGKGMSFVSKFKWVW